MHLSPILQLIGTLWPIAGLILVALAAVNARGSIRWWILFLGPIVAVAPAWLYADRIAYDGNLLFVLLLIVSAIGLMIYYPVLVVVAAVVYSRSRNKGRRAQ